MNTIRLLKADVSHIEGSVTFQRKWSGFDQLFALQSPCILFLPPPCGGGVYSPCILYRGKVCARQHWALNQHQKMSNICCVLVQNPSVCLHTSTCFQHSFLSACGSVHAVLKYTGSVAVRLLLYKLLCNLCQKASFGFGVTFFLYSPLAV